MPVHIYMVWKRDNGFGMKCQNEYTLILAEISGELFKSCFVCLLKLNKLVSNMFLWEDEEQGLVMLKRVC